MVRRTKEDAEKTRAKILAQAKKLFQKQGFADTSVAQISDKANVSKGALFHYFPTKEDLFRAVWNDLQVAMDAATKKAAIAARSSDDPYAAFLAGTRTYFDWAIRPDYQTIVLIDGPSVLGMAGWYEADAELGRDNTLAGMSYLARQGLIDPELIEPLAVMFHNSLNGAGFAISRGSGSLTADSAFRAFETMLRSIGRDHTDRIRSANRSNK